MTDLTFRDAANYRTLGDMAQRIACDPATPKAVAKRATRQAQKFYARAQDVVFVVTSRKVYRRV